jgi:hypothetical protein
MISRSDPVQRAAFRSRCLSVVAALRGPPMLGCTALDGGWAAFVARSAARATAFVAVRAGAAVPARAAPGAAAAPRDNCGDGGGDHYDNDHEQDEATVMVRVHGSGELGGGGMTQARGENCHV